MSEEKFIVSALKYRPAIFDQVVGQSNITETLVRAIEQNHLAHAYLFCGPRGVGKTTCARIFAKVINADAKEIDEDFSFNIFELDAASNNSVEDIRSLTEQVRIPPQVGKYKVYIIDEVHMLSSGAFNAFLKTLEEPPAHAIFILATTEKHKILPTILSRCQIFDFNRIEIPSMVMHLGKIAVKENISVEPDALHVIAQKADGALRDALSIFDQVASFTNNNITYQKVIDNLNILDYEYYFKITDAIDDESIEQALILFNEVVSKGFDPHHFINGLGEHLRNILVAKNAETIALLEVGDSIKGKYKNQSQKLDLRWLVQAMEFTNNCDLQYRSSKNTRLLVEVTLMQMCSIKYNMAEKKKPVNS